VSLTLGAPAVSREWTFPEGLWADGLAQQWHVYNPGDREAEVELQIIPAEGDPVEPIDLTVPARTQVVVDAGTTKRVAAGVAHSSTIVSLNGEPIVELCGWVLPLGEASGNTDEWIVVHNPNPVAVTVSISALAGGQVLAIEGLQDLEAGPGDRLALRIGDHIERTPLPLLVEATGNVVVERDLYRVRATGVTTVVGIPLP
jgi:hypothetical protein